MDEFRLVFYRKANGDCPVAEFLCSLNREMRFKMMQKLDNLELYGNQCTGDATKPVGEGIFELRAQNRTDITRICFFFDRNREIVVTHGFVKKDRKMPRAELEAAKRYRADYMARRCESERYNSPERNRAQQKEDTPVGPRWRVEFDEILRSASRRSALTESGKGKSVDFGKDTR